MMCLGHLQQRRAVSSACVLGARESRTAVVSDRQLGEIYARTTHSVGQALSVADAVSSEGRTGERRMWGEEVMVKSQGGFATSGSRARDPRTPPFWESPTLLHLCNSHVCFKTRAVDTENSLKYFPELI